MSGLPPFHLAIAVDDLAAACRFYGEVLECAPGRRAAHWADYDFFGHQLVLHQGAPGGDQAVSAVDGDQVPVPHFGVVLDLPRWRALVARLRECDVEFLLQPHLRFVGEPGEQGTFFLRDPAGNVLEFKGFSDLARQLFATG